MSLECSLAEPEVLLRVRDLHVNVPLRKRTIYAARGVSFTVRQGEALGIVGESGSGKSLTALSIMGLLPFPARVTSGSIQFLGREIVGASDRALRRIRGAELAMVFQDPLTCLNPLITVGQQVSEAIRLHENVSRAEARTRALEAMARVRIPRPRERFDDYPHQLSGGMRQRAMLAMALVCEAKLLIADEPTTALDVTTQARVLNVIDDLRQKFGMGIVLISHDIGVVGARADRIAVMYAGQIVEQGRKDDVLTHAAHPYTRALMQSVLTPLTPRRSRLAAIPGTPPLLTSPPSGCAFAPRCPRRSPECTTDQPQLEPVGGDDHRAACFHPMVAGASTAEGGTNERVGT